MIPTGRPARRLPPQRGDRLRADRTLLGAALLGLVVVASALVILLVRAAPAASVNERAWSSVESASAMARFFAALILLLFPAERARGRLGWVALGFFILGLGRLLYGSLAPALGYELATNESLYASLIVWSMAGALFALGLLPNQPPRLTVARAVAVLTLFSVGAALLWRIDPYLPPLVGDVDIAAAAARREVPLPGLTAWHWMLSLLPLGLALAATAGALRQRQRAPLGGWLVISMVLLAGSQLHNLLWPSAYTPVLTSANLLRLAFAVVLVTGGVLELRTIAVQRQAVAQRLRELSSLRGDFTRMVAHELQSPLAAIRGYAEVLRLEGLDEETRRRAADAISSETALLETLIGDLRAAAAIERDDFRVERRPVPLDALLEDAAAWTRALPGGHTIELAVPPVMVLADPSRIGQVLRNLLGNATKYAPPGTTIGLWAEPLEERVRICVRDQGPGIADEERELVFEKYTRGSQRPSAPGIGLGLYLSQRIVEAHGGRIVVESAPGQGATFSFELERAVTQHERT